MLSQEATPSRKHAYIFTPLNPLLFSKTWVYRVYIIFLISAQNTDCGYSLKLPRRGGSNEYHNLCFEQKHEKKKTDFLSEKFHFGVLKFSVFLNMRVLVKFIETGFAFFGKLVKSKRKEFAPLMGKLFYSWEKIISFQSRPLL